MWWILFVLLAVRALFVVSLADVFFYLEELEKGATAKAILSGLGVPHHQLSAHYFEGGAFVAAHLKALMFLVVGPSVLAHKLVALLVCALVFLAGHGLVRTNFGARAALVFGGLFVFGPESFQKLALLHLGNHWDGTLFLLLVLSSALAILFADEPRVRTWVAFGLAAGFGCYFSYQTVLAVASMALIVLVRRPRLALGRHGLAGLAAFALGLAPLWITLALVGREVFDIHGQALFDPSSGARRSIELARSLFEDRNPREVANALIHPAATLASIAYVLWRGGALRARCTPLVVYLATWVAAYASSGFAVGEVTHYLLLARLSPLWIASILIQAAALGDALGRRGAFRRAAACATGLLLALGAANAVAIVAEGRGGSPVANLAYLARTKGYVYPHYFKLLLGHLEGSERERLTVLTLVDDDPRLVYPAIASAAASGVATDRRARVPLATAREEFHALLALLDEVDPHGRAEFLRGLGARAAELSGGDVVRALDLARQLGAEIEGPLAEGIGRFGAHYFYEPAEIVLETARVVGHPLAEPYFRGLGFRFQSELVMSSYGGALILDAGAALAWIDRLPEGAVPLAREGFAAAQELWSL